MHKTLRFYLIPTQTPVWKGTPSPDSHPFMASDHSNRLHSATRINPFMPSVPQKWHTYCDSKS